MGKIKNGEVLSLEKGEQKKIAKQTKKLKKSITDGEINIIERKPKRLNAAQARGLIYIAHIPHGFFEEQMKNYFKQFGVITNVKVCRSRKNGNSKGYGYVEFLHPEVAKIAAETMNNYLMFKKRIVAEYVPYEKRPKGLFRGKPNTTAICSTKVKREKQISINSTLEPKVHLRRSKSRYTNFVKKMRKLQNSGIESNVQPTDLPEEISNENPAENEPTPATHQPDPYDSEIEVRIPQKKSRKSITPTPSKSSTKKSKSSVKSRSSRKSGSVEAKESNRVLLAKSLDSVKTLLSKKSSSKSTNLKSVPSVKKVNKATSNPKLRKKRETREVKVKGISKKVTKANNLSPEMLKKIAQELIRKKGHSLLNLVGSPKRRSGRKKSEK